MARTKERNPQFQWVGPVVESVYSFYVKSDSGLVLKSLEDAKGLRFIGVVRDDARDQLLTQAGFTNLERTTDNVMNAKKLLAGRIDAMVTSHLGIGDLMAAAGAPREQVREALPITRIQFWIAFSKGTPEATVAAWNRAFDAMRKDRTLERILRREVPAWTPPGAPVTVF
jgi:polar amino acid transport system substrate-binding protein